MNDLTFIVNWGTNKERALSGTNFSIYKALANHFNVVDHQLLQLSKLEKGVNKIFPSMNSMNKYVIQKNRKSLNEIEGPVFQFEEILKDSINRNTFIYQDLCVDYLIHLYNNDLDTFNLSGFQKCKYYDIVKRNECQIDYYNTCSEYSLWGNGNANI